MLTVEYWEAEVVSFRSRLASVTPEKVRWLLRGLAVLATEITQDQPDTAPSILHDFHECLNLVKDAGIAFHFESWLRCHASPEIAAQVEREFKHP